MALRDPVTGGEPMDDGRPTDRADLLGGRYAMGPLIGQGGMAVVHEGHDHRLDRPVALKLLRPEFAHEPALRRRFESEARLAARLAHPNVVWVLDTGEEDGKAYIVMERLSGRTLHDEMAAGPLPLASVQALAVQMLGALSAAHEAGIVHRDIKPGNILLGPSGEWKLGDFGIAKAAEMPAGDHTGAGLLIGTPAYLAPERFLGGDATVATDIFALGVVLYEAVAGRKPFEAGGPNAYTPASTARLDAPLSTLRPEVDPALGEAIERALAADPAQRFGSAAEMAAAVSGAPTSAEPTTGPTSWADVPPAVAAEPGTVPLSRPAPTAVLRSPTPSDPLGRLRGGLERAVSEARSRPVVMWVAAAVVAVLVLIALVSTGGSPRHSPAQPGPSASASSTTTPASAGSLPPGLDQALNHLQSEVGR